MSKRGKKDTARYLISNFTYSVESFKYKWSGSYNSVLRTIGDIMDANFNRGGQRIFEMEMVLLGKFARVSPKTAGLAINYFVHIKMIELLRKKESNKGVYGLGELLSLQSILPKCSSVESTSSSVESTSSSVESTEPLERHNSIYNSIHNRGINFLDEKEKEKWERTKEIGIAHIDKILDNLGIKKGKK